MSSAARKTVIKIQSDWLCRDLLSWRVRVPCVGGSGRFLFKEHGGSENALVAAKKFQKKAIKLLESDRKYYAQHGELPYREALPITNTSGYLGVYRILTPTKTGHPYIQWCATWRGHNGRKMSQCYTTVNFVESECKKKAIKKRQEMMAHVLLSTN